MHRRTALFNASFGYFYISFNIFNRNNEIDSNMEAIPGPSREYHRGNEQRDGRSFSSSNSLRVNPRGFERMTISPR